jgi:hypothetical protein
VDKIVDKQGRRMAMEQMRAHLSRAEGELGAALRFLDPKSEDEIDLVRAAANARTSVGDALETIQVRLGEPE